MNPIFYIDFYDPEFHKPDGTYDGGTLVVCGQATDATEFETAVAFLLWKTGPTCECHSQRADGKPNRPLSAFTVELLPKAGVASL